MKVIVDDRIPYIKDVILSLVDEVIFVPGAEIDADIVKNADALLVRTRTRCDETLLAGSRVKYIGTATTGIDHLDTDYLRQAGIVWENCPGSNAMSVVQYVETALLALDAEKNIGVCGLTIGIVGAGRIGNGVAKRLFSWGSRILKNDPPREKILGGKDYVSLDLIAEKADVITFHTPLTFKGRNATYHLFNEKLLAKLKRRPILINTSRGEVVDNELLVQALDKGLVSEAIIDAWENEPAISPELLERAFIATPHIAGYSADGKANASRLTLKAFCSYFNLPQNFKISPPPVEGVVPSYKFKEQALLFYDPRHDTARLKANPKAFEALRDDYPLRREQISINNIY